MILRLTFSFSSFSFSFFLLQQSSLLLSYPQSLCCPSLGTDCAGCSLQADRNPKPIVPSASYLYIDCHPHSICQSFRALSCLDYMYFQHFALEFCRFQDCTSCLLSVKLNCRLVDTYFQLFLTHFTQKYYFLAIRLVQLTPELLPELLPSQLCKFFVFLVHLLSDLVGNDFS